MDKELPAPFSKPKNKGVYKMNVPERHQFKIAKDTLRLSDAGVLIMGGMTKPEARTFLKRIGWSEKRITKYEN